MFQLFVTVARVLVSVGLAVALFPVWALLFVLTSPLRLFSPHFHGRAMDSVARSLLRFPRLILN